MTIQLTPTEEKSLLTIGLMAAFADGGHSDVERAEVKRIAESLKDNDFNASEIYQRVLMRQTILGEAVGPLMSTEARQYAYELAVCVSEADGLLNEAEKSFLAELRRELKLDTQTAESFQQKADALTLEPVAKPPAPEAVPPLPAAPPPIPAASATDIEVDRMVLNYSILNGALELLPESLATMAIVPLQMKMVYGIGKRHGYELDRRHIGELLGAAGVGMSSQVLEGFAHKLIGGFLGKAGRGFGRKIGNQVASSAMSFASTYALGQLAQRYYAGGRQLSGPQLKQLFTSLSDQARSLHGRYAGEIQQRASTINPSQIMSLVRGQ